MKINACSLLHGQQTDPKLDKPSDPNICAFTLKSLIRDFKVARCQVAMEAVGG